MNARILIYLLISFIVFPFSLVADEGMWLPIMLKQLKEKDMQKAGMKISADDIYSINNASLKDAVVIFGRGCTGEIISSEGLLLTNHHCGFSQIQDHSSLENDYIKNGFWAKSKEMELTNPGLTATFIIRMENVTDSILSYIKPDIDELEREKTIQLRMDDLSSKAVIGTHYNAYVKSFYNGNEFYLFVTEVFKDIRLVGAPPAHIGNFGRDSDNWSWPRHTADFSLFRIYAGKDNLPAEYSPDNVPLKPRKHLSISTEGVKENDFTLVYGFPGRTNEYLSSSSIEHLLNESNPLKIKLRSMRLEVMNTYMNQDRKIFIQYADKYASVSNYHKKWTGESKGLKRANALAKKREREAEFQKRVDLNPSFAAYKSLLSDIEKAQLSLNAVQPEYDFYVEGIFAIELLRFAYQAKALAEGPLDNMARETYKKSARTFFKDYSAQLDKDVASSILLEYYTSSAKSIPGDGFSNLKPYSTKNQINSVVDSVFQWTVFADSTKLFLLIDQADSSRQKGLKEDPAFKLSSFYFDRFKNVVQKNYQTFNNAFVPLQRTYMKALREVFTEKIFYPDANSTLRVTYGKIEGYQPADAVTYHWQTESNGILEKSQMLNVDYEIDERLRSLIEAKNFGPYADKNTGKLMTCFAASNHTTGGNSGSPVLNAKGELIGTNFDRNWEGTMSDIFYDVNQVRNITLDVRYMLWVIDIYAQAPHLIQEMTINPKK